MKATLNRLSFYTPSNLTILTVMISFRVIFDLVYVLLISNYYADQGFLRIGSWSSWLLSWLVFILVSILLHLVPNSAPVKNILDILFVLFLMPATTLFAFGGVAPDHMLLTVLLLMIVTAGLHLTGRIPDVFPLLERFSKPAAALLVLLCGGLVLYTFIGLILEIKLPDSASLIQLITLQVYDLRAQITMSVPLTIAFKWTSFAVLPFVLCISVKHRRVPFILLSVALEVALFFMTGQKTILFIPVVILIVFLISKLKAFVFWGVLAASAVTVIAGFFSSSSYAALSLINLLYRRSLMVPALLNTQYIDFAEKFGTIGFSGSRLGDLLHVSVRYPVGTAHLIGLNYQGTITAANTGIIGSGYLSFGLFGVILSAILFALCIGMIVYCLKKHSSNLIVPLMVPIMTIALNSPFSLLLLLNGLGITVVLCFLYRISDSYFSRIETAGHDSDAEKSGSPISKFSLTGRSRIVTVTSLVCCFVLASFTFYYSTESSALPQIALKDSVATRIYEAEIPVTEAQIEAALLACDLKNAPTISDKCLYITSVLRICNTPDSEFLDLSKTRITAHTKDIYRACNRYAELTLDEQIEILNTLIALRAFSDPAQAISDPLNHKDRSFATDSAAHLNAISQYWLTQPVPQDTAYQALLAGMFQTIWVHKYVDSTEISDGIHQRAKNLYEACIAEIDQTIGVPLWLREDTLRPFSDTVRILDGLITYESAVDELTVDESDVQGKTLTGSYTQSQLSGSLALFYYGGDGSYREEGWLDGFTNDPEMRIAAKEEYLPYALDLYDRIPLYALDQVGKYYRYGFEDHLYNNPFVYLNLLSITI
ncbi:MAG: hypothetical protein LBN36_01825 [Clostridiales Family XIII bacterium]|jgi:hypothetical protein|nr:hypothetical protein [Clostridiales Family XIII bacterium]